MSSFGKAVDFLLGLNGDSRDYWSNLTVEQGETLVTNSRISRVSDSWVRMVIADAQRLSPSEPGGDLVQMLIVRLAGNEFVSPERLREIADVYGLGASEGNDVVLPSNHGNLYVELALNPACPADVLKRIHRALMNGIVTSGDLAVAEGIVKHPNASQGMKDEAAGLAAEKCMGESHPAGARTWTELVHAIAGGYGNWRPSGEVRSRLLVAATVTDYVAGSST